MITQQGWGSQLTNTRMRHLCPPANLSSQRTIRRMNSHPTNSRGTKIQVINKPGAVHLYTCEVISSSLDILSPFKFSFLSYLPSKIKVIQVNNANFYCPLRKQLQNSKGVGLLCIGASILWKSETKTDKHHNVAYRTFQ